MTSNTVVRPLASASFSAGRKSDGFSTRIFEMIELAADRYKTSRADIVMRMFSPEENQSWSEALKLPLNNYVASLAGGTVHGVGGLKNSVPNLIQQWARVTVGGEAERIALAAADPGVDPTELIRSATRALDDVAVGLRGSGRGKTLFSISEAADVALDEVQAANQPWRRHHRDNLGPH